MVVTIQLRQITSILQDGPLYRVQNTVEKATGISPALFVYKTVTQLFDHYATAADIATYPDSYDEAVATNAAFYRQPSVIRDWKTTQNLLEDVQVTQARLRAVVNDVARVNGSLQSDATLIISSEE
jgi:hypothetical protein